MTFMLIITPGHLVLSSPEPCGGVRGLPLLQDGVGICP